MKGCRLGSPTGPCWVTERGGSTAGRCPSGLAADATDICPYPGRQAEIQNKEVAGPCCDEHVRRPVGDIGRPLGAADAALSTVLVAPRDQFAPASTPRRDGQSAHATPERRQHAELVTEGQGTATEPGSACHARSEHRTDSAYSTRECAAHKPAMHHLLRGGQGRLPRGIRHLHNKRSLCLDEALNVLTSPALEPGDALQAAQDISNLSNQSKGREQLATSAVLDALIAATRLHRREASTHIYMALARIAADPHMAERLVAQSALMSALLEAAELPQRLTSICAGRALALCIRTLPMGPLDDVRLLAVLTALLKADQTEVRVDVLRTLGSISQTAHGVRAMSQNDMWTAMLGEHAGAADTRDLPEWPLCAECVILMPSQG